MKKILSILVRLILGLLLGALLIAVLFALTLTVIPTWGATQVELTRSLPGDELTSDPNLIWTNAITIEAPPEDVWPWIAQIGDSRGGFYSYTFIENQVGKLTGASDYNVIYTNANEIHPEWQDPQPGRTGTIFTGRVYPTFSLPMDLVLVRRAGEWRKRNTSVVPFCN
jgi:hypothetical protein